MSDYQRDAYVNPLPFIIENNTHAVVVDILEGEEVEHQIVLMAMGQHNATEMAEKLNKWRDQTRFTQ
jgi:hypothetical protein